METLSKLILACLCSFMFLEFVSAAEDIPSTSRNTQIDSSTKNEKIKSIEQQQQDNSVEIITFSEFSTGTKIVDQYADRGIKFGGDSPFITGDGANPTSPVLSGSPIFDGAIEGEFVDPITHEPTTVNHFELDGGYFNNLSSTKLSWYNSSGELIREVLDSKYGIQHFTIDDEGIASFRIEVVSQEDAGYAIDNVSFKIKKFSLDKITHKVKSNVANTFTIYLKTDEGGLDDICEYKFFAEDANQKLEGTGCKLSGDKKASKIDFEITKSPYNLIDAEVSICKNGSCKLIEDIKNFSVYGTNFDVSKDGFSFYNGEWNKFMLVEDFWCWKVAGCSVEQESYMKSFRNLVNSFKTFLPHLREDDVEKELIGYYESEDDKKKQKRKKFGGVCHGLAFAAIANFHNKKETNAWGITLISSNTQEENENVFQEHWDNIESESAKPFERIPYSYNAANNHEDAFHALGKIGVYFTTQKYYSYGGFEEAWVGTYNKRSNNDLNSLESWHKNILKQGGVSNFVFDLKKTGGFFGDSRSGGHSIIVTEMIKYNSNILFVMHDNNFVDTFSMLEFKEADAFREETFIFETAYIRHWLEKRNNKNNVYDVSDYGTYDDFKNMDPYKVSYYNKFGYYISDDDKLSIYGKEEEAEKQVIDQQQILDETVNNTIEYPYLHHLLIRVIGGKLLKITDTQIQKELMLSPINGQLEQNKGYFVDNSLVTEFLLPGNSRYKIELQKYKQYPAFIVYVKIPTTDGKVEVINYENLATNSDDATEAHFFVGNGNTDKKVKREGESDVSPDYDEYIDLKITPATFLKAVALSSGVKLSWNLPDNSNLQEIVIVRKENSEPASLTDGMEVYRGTEEAYSDASAGNNRKYYYRIYALAKNGDVAEGDFLFIDTHKATLLGYVKDSKGNPVANVGIILKNGAGLVKKVINTEVTDKNGYFSFANLPLGTYLVVYSHLNYTFASNEMTVELDNKNKEISQEAIGVPLLTLSANEVLRVGDSENIVWNGLHINESSFIDVSLYQNNIWKSIASNLKYGDNLFQWVVTPPVGKAKIKVALHSDPSVYIEKDVIIIKKKLVNASPIAVADTATTIKDTVVTISNVLLNDTDADGDTLSVSAADKASTKGGTVINRNDGTFTFTPKTGFIGADTFTYTVSDGSGGTDVGTVTITVNKPANTSPVAVPDTATTIKDTAVTISNVLLNDTDADDDTLLVSAADTTSTEGGTVVNHNDGTFTFKPKTGYIGTDTFTYTVSDDNGGTDVGEVTITITKPAIIPGDANGDGKINSQDLIKIINHILGVEAANGDPDCNSDGSVNSLDIVCIINKILGK